MKWNLVVDNIFFVKLTISLVLIVLVFFIRYLIIQSIVKHENLESSLRRRWMVFTRNTAIFIVILLLFLIWIEQLQTIGAGLAFIAAAIVVATKEFILNLVGYFYRSASKAFVIGDRIKISGIRGDVLDQNFMGIWLMEVGIETKTHQYTGINVFIPNALFLTNSVYNETHGGEDYVFHIVTIMVKADEKWPRAEACLLHAGNTVSAPYLNEARSRMHYLSRRHALDLPFVEPRVNVQLNDYDKIALHLRVPVPAKRRGRMEAEILRLYLYSMYVAANEENEGKKGLSAMLENPYEGYKE